MENKTSKYFKYAIGEIVLVVIGILIALQINTWNQQKNNQETLKQFIVEFKEELRLNIRDFKNDLELIKNQKKLKNNLLKNKRLDTIPLDSLEKYVETFYINAAYSPVLLNRFENTQISNYGKYDSIFLNLQEYYGFHWPQFNKELNAHNSAVDKEDEFWRYQQNKYELNFSSDNDTFIKDSIHRKIEFIKLIQSPIVRNILKTDLRRKKMFKTKIDAKILMGEMIQKQINKALKD